MKNTLALKGRTVGRPRLTRLYVALAVFLTGMTIFGYIAREVSEGETLRRDSQVLLFINHFSSPALDQIMMAITTAGSVAVVLGVTAIILGVLFHRRQWHAFTFVSFGMVGVLALGGILKLIFERERPSLWTLLVHESTYSFPSGHAMLSATLVLVLTVLAWRTAWRWWVVGVGVLYIVGVGFSRMYLGVHYPTDVIAGWCVAIVWIITVTSVLGIINWHRGITKLSANQAKTHI